MKKFFSLAFTFALCATTHAHVELAVGRAGHAFDHLGNIGEQAEAAARSGATVIYATGLGGLGYAGLPPAAELEQKTREVAAYNKKANKAGIRLIIGYVCATSMVKLNTFDKNWTPEFRAQFSSKPSEWRQIGADGKPLRSWYGGDYEAACMNNPDWRAYEKEIVRRQIETGHDGIFFDNPTVHQQGCYCRFCMAKFSAYLVNQGVAISDLSMPNIRKLAGEHTAHFRQFRANIARDFLADIRAFAQTVKRGTLITCNNSLNAPESLYAQCKSFGYNICEMSKAEDLVVVEDMKSQPRALSNGQTFEYGPVFKQLHAIGHGKPIVAVTIAEIGGIPSDELYVAPPNLVRLAMAEAAANNSSHLWWPDWPEAQREKMITAIKPQAEFLRRNEAMLNEADFRRDVLVFLPFRRWQETDVCVPGQIAAALSRANIQYEVASEDDFAPILERETKRGRTADARFRQQQIERAARAGIKIKELPPLPPAEIGPIAVVESLSVLKPAEMTVIDEFQAAGGRVIAADQADWMNTLQSKLKPSLEIKGPAQVRAIVHDQTKRTLVHLYNLNIERVSAFEDKIHPATNVTVRVFAPFPKVRNVQLLTADENTFHGPLKFTTIKGPATIIETTIPHLETSAILTIQP